MNITKQQWTIIGVVVAVILVWYFFLRKKKVESGYGKTRGSVSAKETKCPDTCQTISVTTPSGVQTGCKCPTTETGSIGWGKPSA